MAKLNGVDLQKGDVKLTPNNALFLDVDGTLLDIAARPTEVTVSSHLVSTLTRMHHYLGGALALISGRTLANLDRLFSPLRLSAAGQHGAEIRLGDFRTLLAKPLPLAVGEELLHRLHTIDKITVEDKGCTLAVHYRQAPEQGEEVKSLLRELAHRHDLSLMAGKMVWELRRPGITKAKAIAFFSRHEPFTSRRPIFVGDDRTDAEGFDFIDAQGGLSLPVGRDHGTTRDTAFAGPQQVRDWLAASLSPEVQHG